MLQDRLLYRGAEWDYDTIGRLYEAIERIALNELKLDVYPNQMEIIGSEQMLEAYASGGMPLLYGHWSFGKRIARDEAMYRKGWQSLAYEVVINSNPCVSYIMEENTATLHATVIAHAAFGHNHFFKNNYTFRQWTDAEGILDYMAFVKTYIAKCEERHGLAEVERLLDAAHALQRVGIHRFPRSAVPSLEQEAARADDRRRHQEQTYDVLWRTLPEHGRPTPSRQDRAEAERRALLRLPQENLLYFIEKYAPRLAPWQREVLRIVRNLAQYFYPQMQTKVMNEGCATWVHHRIMRRLHEQGLIDDGAYMEFLTVHTNVLTQPGYDDKRFGGLNPYAIGFAVMQDIVRAAEHPTEEDRAWFPDFAGSGDGVAVLRDVWADYRDDSFLAQFLSPKVMRDFRMFQLVDDADKPNLLVSDIHDEIGYRDLRRALAREYDPALLDPDIQVADVDLMGDRRLILHHLVREGRLLDEADTRLVLAHIANLWGYDVLLREIGGADPKPIREFRAQPQGVFGKG